MGKASGVVDKEEEIAGKRVSPLLLMLLAHGWGMGGDEEISSTFAPLLLRCGSLPLPFAILSSHHPTYGTHISKSPHLIKT